jgi:DNA-binding NtrC family response regulator
MSDASVASRLVLVVEADPTVQRHLASLLANLGYEPVVTGSVAESLTVLSHNRFLLSLVDLDLDGADGTELLRHLKVQGGRPGPVIVIANGGSIQRMPEVAALGAEDMLQKPFTPEDLENVIKSAIARPSRAWGQEPQDDRGRRLQQELALWQSPQMREVREIILQAARAVLGDPLLARSPWPGDLPNGETDGAPTAAKVGVSLKDISRKAALAAERQAILDALEQTGWNRMRAAKLLNISYRALLYKIKDAALGQHEHSSSLV